MQKVLETKAPFSIYRIQRTKPLKDIGFGSKDYFETFTFYRNAKKHGFKVGVVNKQWFMCGQWRDVNKGYPRDFIDYKTYRPEKQDKLYGIPEERRKKIHVPDLDTSIVESERAMPKKMDRSIEPVDILIVTYHRKPFLMEMIDEIVKYTKYPYRLIVVDNGSRDGTREWIEEQYKKGIIWKFMFTAFNQTMTEALHEGIKMVESSIFITTPEDIPPPRRKKCWLTELVGLSNEYPEFLSINYDFGNVSFFKHMRAKYGKEKYTQMLQPYRTELIPKLKAKTYKKITEPQHLYNYREISDMRPYLLTLHSIARYFKAKEKILIFEIGVRRAISTKAFLRGVSERFDDAGAEVWSCDVDDRDKFVRSDELRKNWNFIHKHSQAIKWDKPIDILMIDGNHHYEDVKDDYEKYEPFVKEGGLIIMHDVNPGFTGAGKYFEEIKYNKFILNLNPSGLGLIRKEKI